MASFWQRVAKTKGAQLAAPAAPAPNNPVMHIHSLIGGNGQHLVLPPGTGGQPWVGHKGSAPQPHPFSPAATFSLHTGGVNMPSPSRLRSTVPAVVNSLAGQAAGTYQLAPGGGVNMPAAQRGPGRVGK